MYSSSYSSYSYMFSASWVSATEGETNCSDPSASCVTLKVNGNTTEEELLYEGENITFNCSGSSRHQIQLLEIGQKLTFEEQKTRPSHIVQWSYEPLNCNGSQASGNHCSKVVVMTATPEMDKKAYQCRTVIPGSSDVYSRGVYINGNYNPHFCDFSNKTCILYAVTIIQTTSLPQGMCVAANDKEHVFQYFIFHNFTETLSPSATNGQQTSTATESPTFGNDGTFVVLFIFTTVITP